MPPFSLPATRLFYAIISLSVVLSSRAAADAALLSLRRAPYALLLSLRHCRCHARHAFCRHYLATPMPLLMAIDAY